MELTTIDMPKAEARAAFEQYREAVRERHTAEDEQIMRAYREIASGTPLIRLSETIAAGGTTTIKVGGWPVRVPRLAVSRAHAEFAHTNGVARDGALRIQGRREVAHNNSYDVVAFGAGTFPGGAKYPDATSTSGWWEFGGITCRLRAMAPNVPPPLRPVHHLRNYYLLWEAEWAIDPTAPVDPALLKRIGGDLYAVLAVWDLTEVERAVLAGRVAS